MDGGGTGRLSGTGRADDELIRRTVEVMGTVVSFHVRPGDAAPESVFLGLAEARARLRRADAVFSTWKPDSPVSRLRRGEITLGGAPPEVTEVLELCERCRTLSGGWFDPWAAPGGVDPTGLVKGWAAERAIEAVAEAGVAGVMVSAGGDVALRGERAPGRPWRIGIQNPFDRGTVAVVCEPAAAGPQARGAVATSGTYERGDHVYDPFRCVPAAAVASASITGPRLDVADALATALLAGGDDVLEILEGKRTGGLSGGERYEALLIRPDGTRRSTPGFPAEGRWRTGDSLP